MTSTAFVHGEKLLCAADGCSSDGHSVVEGWFGNVHHDRYVGVFLCRYHASTFRLGGNVVLDLGGDRAQFRGAKPYNGEVPAYRGRDGGPMTAREWAASYQTNREVCLTELDGNVRISTVWLGLNHNPSDGGPPLIFETMIFGGPLDEHQRRYSTELAARIGHAEMVFAAKAAALEEAP